MTEPVRRWLAPAGVLAAAVAAYTAVRLAPPAVAEAAIVPYALTLVLGPPVAYAGMRAGGASVPRSVVPSLAVLLAWLGKEWVRVGAVFGLAETLFYALNPLSVGLFGFAALQMATVELVLARRRLGHWRLASGAGAVVGGVLVAAGWAAWIGADSGGRDLFYGYIELYRRWFPAAG